MRKTAITLAATTAIGLCLGVSAGSAADLGLPWKAAPVAAAPYSWTGCYVGAHAGLATQTDGNASQLQFSGLTESLGTNGANGTGAVLGGQAGCNYQIQQLVVGFEGDGSWSSLQNTSNNVFSSTTDGEGAQTRNRYDFDITARVGAAFDRLLVYGKGGFAWGRFDFTQTAFSGSFSETASGSATLPGVLIGIGMEYAFLNNWTAKIEYNYIAYAQQTVGLTGTTSDGDSITLPGQSFGATKQIIKVGANYKFSWY